MANFLDFNLKSLTVFFICSSFYFNVCYGAATCSCPKNDSAMMEEMEEALDMLISNQLQELEKIKAMLATEETCPSTIESHLETIERQAVSMQSLFDYSVRREIRKSEFDSENGFQVCTSTLETFYTKVSNAAENNKKSLEELKTEREQFQKEKQEEVSTLKDNFEKKTENLRNSVNELRTLLNEKSSAFNTKITSLTNSFDSNEKELTSKIDKLEKFVNEKICNCPAVNSKLGEMTKFMQGSKAFEEKTKQELEKNLKEQREKNKELEGKIKVLTQNLQSKFDESKKLIDDKIRTVTDKITGVVNSVANVESTMVTKITRVEQSMPTAACSCPTVNKKLDELTKFMAFAKIHLALFRFILVDESLTYSEAEDVCKNIGGKLASIPDQDTQILVQKAIESMKQSGAWIGLKSNDQVGGIFKWNDGKTISAKNKKQGYNNWHPFEPNDYAKGPVCARIIGSYGGVGNRGFGLWADSQCDVRQAAVCETPV